MQEQNKFNAAEAQKLRDWQEMMYRMFGTSSAKANDMRAAGLNALLGDVSASGNVGSGAAATAAESAQMLPTDYSFVGDAANRGLAAYNSTRSVDASVSLQKSQENVNKSIEGVNMAQKGLMESQTDMQKMTYKFAMDTYQNRLLQEQFKAELANWQGFDAMYDARLKAFSLYNVMPQEVEKNVAQTMSFYASAFRDIADGKYTLKQTENYGKWLSIQQTFAHAATVQGQAALMQGRAALTNAAANASYLGKLGKYYGSLTSGQNMTNEMSRYYTDFMLGKMPIGKAESILRQTPYRHLLDLNIQQNEWSLNKLMQEPDLIRSLVVCISQRRLLPISVLIVMILIRFLSVVNLLPVWLKTFLMVSVTLRLSLNLTKVLLQMVELHRRLAGNLGLTLIVKILTIALLAIDNKLGAKVKPLRLSCYTFFTSIINSISFLLPLDVISVLIQLNPPFGINSVAYPSFLKSF